MDGFANYGYNRLAKKYNVKLVNLDAEKVEIVAVHRREGLPASCGARGEDHDGPGEQLRHFGGEAEDARPGGNYALAEERGDRRGIKDTGAGLANAGPGGGRSDKRLMHGGGSHGINYNIFTLSSVAAPAPGG